MGFIVKLQNGQVGPGGKIVILDVSKAKNVTVKTGAMAAFQADGGFSLCFVLGEVNSEVLEIYKKLPFSEGDILEVDTILPWNI